MGAAIATNSPSYANAPSASTSRRRSARAATSAPSSASSTPPVPTVRPTASESVPGPLSQPNHGRCASRWGSTPSTACRRTSPSHGRSGATVAASARAMTQTPPGRPGTARSRAWARLPERTTAAWNDCTKWTAKGSARSTRARAVHHANTASATESAGAAWATISAAQSMMSWWSPKRRPSVERALPHRAAAETSSETTTSLRRGSTTAILSDAHPAANHPCTTARAASASNDGWWARIAPQRWSTIGP